MLQKTHSTTGVQTPTQGDNTPIQASDTPAEERKQPAGEVLGFVDWITCTFPYGTDIEDLMSFLGGTWNRTPSGSRFYPCAQCCGAMSILYGGPVRMGVNLQITGKGCRELEVTTIKNDDWLAFLGELLQRGASFSRLDIALDDHIGILNLDELISCSRAGLVSTRFKKVKYIDEGETGTAGITRSFIKYGSDSSETMLKIYDKALEQGKSGHHVRVELVTRRKTARITVAHLVAHGIKIVPQLACGQSEFQSCRK